MPNNIEKCFGEMALPKAKVVVNESAKVANIRKNIESLMEQQKAHFTVDRKKQAVEKISEWTAKQNDRKVLEDKPPCLFSNGNYAAPMSKEIQALYNSLLNQGK